MSREVCEHFVETNQPCEECDEAMKTNNPLKELQEEYDALLRCLKGSSKGCVPVELLNNAEAKAEKYRAALERITEAYNDACYADYRPCDCQRCIATEALKE